VGENFGDKGLEDFEVMAIGCGAALFGEGLLQGAALIHSGCGDDVALIGDRLEASKFSRGDLHISPRAGSAVSKKQIPRGNDRKKGNCGHRRLY
jgi:hypothetical protein